MDISLFVRQGVRLTLSENTTLDFFLGLGFPGESSPVARNVKVSSPVARNLSLTS